MPNLTSWFKVRPVVLPADVMEVAVTRAEAEKQLTDTCTILRGIGVPRVLATMYANEPCRVEDLAPGIDPAYSEINQAHTNKKLTVRVATVLLQGDQVVHAGHTYEIYSVITDRTPNLNNNAYMHTVTT
jgi:hypothetical protein